MGRVSQLRGWIAAALGAPLQKFVGFCALAALARRPAGCDWCGWLRGVADCGCSEQVGPDQRAQPGQLCRSKPTLEVNKQWNREGALFNPCPAHCIAQHQGSSSIYFWTHFQDSMHYFIARYLSTPHLHAPAPPAPSSPGLPP